jgi:multidrug efflux system outer membrane protein
MNTTSLNPASGRRRPDFAALGGQSRGSSLALLVGLFAAGALAGCSLPAVGPDYRRPETPTASSYDQASDQLPVAAGNPVAKEWWRDFADPDLDRYVAAALTENQGLKAALARVEQARALTGEARASYLPMVGAFGLVSRERTSETTTNQFPNSLTTTYRLPLTLGECGGSTKARALIFSRPKNSPMPPA